MPQNGDVIQQWTPHIIEPWTDNHFQNAEFLVYMIEKNVDSWNWYYLQRVVVNVPKLIDQ